MFPKTAKTLGQIAISTYDFETLRHYTPCFWHKNIPFVIMTNDSSTTNFSAAIKCPPRRYSHKIINMYSSS